MAGPIFHPFRDFQINGDALVTIKGGQHYSGTLYPSPALLGLSVGPIRVSIHPRHRPLHVDDYGPDIPADVMKMLADATIRMNLIHYDTELADICMMEATGQYSSTSTDPTVTQGLS